MPGNPIASLFHAARRTRRSALVLLLSNLLPLYGVLVWDWEVFPLLLLFWCENVIIGGLNVFRILLAQNSQGTPRLLVVPFFLVHFGMFTAVHGTFLFELFGPESDSFLLRIGVSDVIAAVSANALWLSIAGFGFSRVWSFFDNYIGGGEYREADATKVMLAVYPRVMVMHVTVLIGGFLMQFLGSPVLGLLVLILLKTGIDLRAHLKEHQATGTPDLD